MGLWPRLWQPVGRPCMGQKGGGERRPKLGQPKPPLLLPLNPNQVTQLPLFLPLAATSPLLLPQAATPLIWTSPSYPLAPPSCFLVPPIPAAGYSRRKARESACFPAKRRGRKRDKKEIFFVGNVQRLLEVL